MVRPLEGQGHTRERRSGLHHLGRTQRPTEVDRREVQNVVRSEQGLAQLPSGLQDRRDALRYTVLERETEAGLDCAQAQAVASLFGYLGVALHALIEGLELRKLAPRLEGVADEVKRPHAVARAREAAAQRLARCSRPGPRSSSSSGQAGAGRPPPSAATRSRA